MDISESRRRSSSLVDQVAHDAGIVKADEHISGSPSAKSGEYEFTHQPLLELPSTTADRMRLAYDNDVSQIGVAHALYGSDAGAQEAKARPGTSAKAVNAFVASLNSPKEASTKMVLQARADDGFRVAELAWQANPRLSGKEGAAAAREWLSGAWGEQMKNDPAFAAGVNRNLSLHERGLSTEAEIKNMSSRLPVDNQCRGTIAG